jgi:hypothetical protein
VGALARRYGIRVTFADSPWLGTSVVVVVPHKYFSPLPAAAATTATTTAATAGPSPAARPAAAAPVAAQPVAEPSEAVDTTPGGLPRRRSKRHEAEGTARHQPAERTERTEETAVSVVPPDASFTGLAAFATAGREAGEESTTEDTEPLGRPSTEHRTEESD